MGRKKKQIISGIYTLTAPDKKVYIGQTRNLVKRIRTHANQLRWPALLKESFLKYGYDSHEIKMVHKLPNDIQQIHLDNYEAFYISQFTEGGLTLLNIRKGGLCGGKVLEAHKNRPIYKLRGRKLSKEHIEKMRASLMGRKPTKETRAKLRESKLGSKNPNFGKKESIEATTKRIAKLTGKQRPPFCESWKQNIAKAKNKIVHQYSLTGEFIKEWPSVKIAKEALKINSIQECATGKYKHAGGYKWVYPNK